MNVYKSDLSSLTWKVQEGLGGSPRPPAHLNWKLFCLLWKCPSFVSLRPAVRAEQNREGIGVQVDRPFSLLLSKYFLLCSSLSLSMNLLLLPACSFQPFCLSDSCVCVSVSASEQERDTLLMPSVNQCCGVMHEPSSETLIAFTSPCLLARVRLYMHACSVHTHGSICITPAD